MSTVAQWSRAAAAAAAAPAASDVSAAEMTDMEAHIQQTNDRLLCIQQVTIRCPPVPITHPILDSPERNSPENSRDRVNAVACDIRTDS